MFNSNTVSQQFKVFLGKKLFIAFIPWLQWTIPWVKFVQGNPITVFFIQYIRQHNWHFQDGHLYDEPPFLGDDLNSFQS